MTTPSPNMGNPVNASKFNSAKLVPPSPPKLQFMDMPKLNFVNAVRLPTVPGESAVPSEGAASGPVVPVAVSHQMGGRRKSTKTTKSTKGTKSSRSKKSGGALIDDVKNLAVPFAILLAKQGLQTMFDKKKTPQTQKTQNVQLSAKAASQTSSSRRRSTAVGGSCGSACASAAAARPVAGGSKSKKQCGGVVPKLLPSSGATGGALPKPPKSLTGGARSQQVKSRFEKLSKEIDAFLQKY